MADLTYYPYRTPLGHITIASNGTALTALAFGDQKFPGRRQATALTNKAANQIQEYLAGKRQLFDLPLDPKGTDFQKRVWRALLDIPYGQTRSYSEIATALDNPRAYRAVGNASNKNPLPIVIPCHRVIGANGSLAGYVGGPKIKKFLIDLEKHSLIDKNKA